MGRSAVVCVLGLAVWSTTPAAWAADPMPAPTGGAAAGPAAAPTSAGEPSTSEFLRELKAVEQQVHELKERVFQSKATLQLLHELVVESATFDSAVTIWHETALSKAYVIESIQYYLDGKPIFGWKHEREDDVLPAQVEIRDQELEAGTHVLQVTMAVRGNGGGLFAYVKDYAVDVQSSYEFEVVAGKRTLLFARPTTEGGVKKAYTERPTLQYEERLEDLGTE
ncbi:MAG TPA: hypothetical protein PKA64_03790 [Myxococcota bacterium]|nr:hypothetical protein [Myxococcota bacterium]